jgi:hypothetical protein
MEGITQGIVSLLPLAGDLPAAVLAYIDPGTGSLVFQVLIAGLLTAGWVLRQVPLAILRACGRMLGRDRQETADTGDLLSIERPASASHGQRPADGKAARQSKAA